MFMRSVGSRMSVDRARVDLTMEELDLSLRTLERSAEKRFQTLHRSAH